MSNEKIENLKQISWEFREAKTTQLTHGYHPFHGKFIPQIPNTLISELTDEGDTVLDPFCGSGTALVEANVLSRNVIGNDMSPLAFLLTSVKTTKYDLNKLQIYFEKIKNSNIDSVLIPDFPDREIWYNETTLNELGQIWYRINKFVNQEEDYFNFFQVAFSSILKKVANKSEKWNWTFIGDNVKPKINKYQDAHQAFNKCVIQMMSGLEEFLNNSTSRTIKVFQEDTRQLDLFLNKKVDMVVTSPPYCFAVDFNKYFRLSYYWFNWDISFYKNNEIGARSKRGKKSALDDYFTEMEQSISVISRVLKSDRYCCFTLGNSTRSKKSINTVKEIVSIAKSKGLLLILNTDRFLSQQTMAQKRIPKESVLVFRNS